MIENIDKMNGWSIEELPNLVFFQEGPGVRNNQYTDSGVKLLNVANLKDGNVYLDNTDRYISEEEAYGKYSHFLVDEGDLIIASSGIKVEYFDKKMGFAKKEHLPLCMNTSTIRFKTLDDNILDIEYFAYFLKTNYFKKQISRLITGSAQLNFGPSHLKQIKVILPPIETQKKIVEALDKAQELIDKRKEQIEVLDELVKSRFIEMFGSPKSNPNNFDVVKFNDITDYIGDIGSNGANSVISANLKMTDTEDYALMVRTLNFTSNDFENNVKYVSKEVYDFFKKSQVFGGELIFNKIGSAGINFVMPYLNRPVSLGLNQIMVRTNEKVNITYLHTLLNTDYGKHQIGTRVQGAVTKSITKGAIKEIPIILPPIELQNEFADFVKQVDKLKSQMETSLKELEDNFNSLMQKAFKGELF